MKRWFLLTLIAKKNHNKWKAMKNWTRILVIFLCTILFEVTEEIWKMFHECSKLFTHFFLNALISRDNKVCKTNFKWPKPLIGELSWNRQIILESYVNPASPATAVVEFMGKWSNLCTLTVHHIQAKEITHKTLMLHLTLDK